MLRLPGYYLDAVSSEHDENSRLFYSLEIATEAAESKYSITVSPGVALPPVNGLHDAARCGCTPKLREGEAPFTVH